MVKTLVLLAVLFGSSVLLLACNTTEGFGKDVKHGGQAIERAADDHK